MAKSFTLRNVPKDVFQYLLKVQSEKKQEKNIGRFGLEPTLYAIVRDYKRCSEAENNNAAK